MKQIETETLGDQLASLGKTTELWERFEKKIWVLLNDTGNHCITG